MPRTSARLIPSPAPAKRWLRFDAAHRTPPAPHGPQLTANPSDERWDVDEPSDWRRPEPEGGSLFE